MFVVYLDPLGPRKAPATQMWQFYKILTRTQPSDVHFFLTAPYLENPEALAARGAPEADLQTQRRMGFRLPTASQVAGASVSLVPSDLFDPLLAKFGMIDQAWATVLTTVYPPLLDFLESELDRLSQSHEIEGILTWANNASLEKAAAARGIPVIHNEVGPLRSPTYEETAYFDLTGVNGHTESEVRYRAFQAEFSSNDPRMLARNELVRIFLKSEFANAYAQTLGREPDFEAGVALQVEDDSNILAYAGTWNSRSLVSHVLTKHTPSQTTVRNHPYSSFPFVSPVVSVDSSPSSLHFVERCKRMYTINSSVGIEALLLDRDAFFAGDNPAAFFVGTNESERTRFLNFLLFNYLIPDSLLFDLEYYRWRLAGRTETEIWERHRALYAVHEAKADPYSGPRHEGEAQMSSLRIWTEDSDLPADLFAWLSIDQNGQFKVQFNLAEWKVRTNKAKILKIMWVPAAGQPCRCQDVRLSQADIRLGTWSSDGSKTNESHFCVGPVDGLWFEADWSAVSEFCIQGRATLVAASNGGERLSPEILQRIAYLETHARNLELHVKAMQKTLSWRITAPLRKLRKLKNP